MSYESREALERLTRLGYRFSLVGNRLRYKYEGIERLDPKMVLKLLKVVKAHKAEALALLQVEADNLPCTACPWCLGNPWSHYLDLPKWCGWWWDHLTAGHRQCRDRREGRVPDPEVTPQPRTTGTRQNRQSESEAGTCYECRHFQPAAPSPNPTQAWGWCRHLDKGRYGVARVCDASAAQRSAAHAKP